jgi:hypothetical protein
MILAGCEETRHEGSRADDKGCSNNPFFAAEFASIQFIATSRALARSAAKYVANRWKAETIFLQSVRRQ